MDKLRIKKTKFRVGDRIVVQTEHEDGISQESYPARPKGWPTSKQNG